MLLAQSPLASTPLATQGGSFPYQSALSPTWSLPVWQKIAPALAIAIATSGLIAPVSVPEVRASFESDYHQAWSEPVRVKPGVSAANQAFFFSQPQPLVFQSAPWFAPFSEPVRFKPALTAANQAFFFYSPDQTVLPGQATKTFNDAWSEPVRFKPALLAGDQPFFSFEPEPPVYETPEWLAPFAEPVRFKPRLIAAANPYEFYSPDRTILPGQQTKTFNDAWSEPVRFKPAVLAGDQPFFFFEPEPPVFETVDWYFPLTEPVRFKPAILAGDQPFFYFEPEPPEFETTDWYAPLSEPVKALFQKSGRLGYLQQAFTADTIVLPLQRQLGWYANLSEPVRLPKGLKVWLQRDFTTDPRLPFNPSQTLIAQQGWYDPVRLPVGLRPWLQQHLAYHPRILPNPNVTGVLLTTETGVDVALIGVYVTSTPSSAAPGTSANVSITEIKAVNSAAASLRGA